VEAQIEEEEELASHLWGRNAVLEALKSGRKIRRILVAKGVKPSATVSLLLELAGQRGVRIVHLDRSELDRLSQTDAHQGILAEAESLALFSLKQLFDSMAQKEEMPFVLALDGITDPQNLGSLLRSAEGMGVHGVIFPQRRSAPISAAVAKASAGALEHLPLVRVTNLPRTLEELKKHGVWVVGTSDRAEKTCFETDLTGKIALVLGSEGKGMSRLVSEKCDLLVRIPMFGKISSLNVGVAGAILMYEVRRQRSQQRS
jgi:23S rRNA (guanosine2251-2'-O)-methyltransferase